MMSLLEKRDAILESLHTQFKALILSVTLVDGRVITHADRLLDRVLLDVANNAAQGISDDGHDHCPNCGVGPLHASESDDLGRCAKCAAASDVPHDPRCDCETCMVAKICGVEFTADPGAAR